MTLSSGFFFLTRRSSGFGLLDARHLGNGPFPQSEQEFALPCRRIERPNHFGPLEPQLALTEHTQGAQV